MDDGIQEYKYEIIRNKLSNFIARKTTLIFDPKGPSFSRDKALGKKQSNFVPREKKIKKIISSGPKRRIFSKDQKKVPLNQPKQVIEKINQWDLEKFQLLSAEINELAESIKRKIGKEDVNYIKKMRKISRLSEVAGRTLIHFSLDPVTLWVGILSLWVHHQLETIEIGHSALHGCWDGLPGAEKFQSKTFRWKCPVDEQAWKREHNILHHQFTNIVGKDPDLNYGRLRPTEKIPWDIFHLTQLIQFFYTAPIFLWVINFYANGLTDLFHPLNDKAYAKILPDKRPKTVLKALSRTAKKMASYSTYNYVLWPALAGPFWWKVLFANTTADMMRNIFSCAVIYAGHFGDHLEYYDSDFKAKGKGEWYKAQIEAAHDFSLPRFFSIMAGALDYQIEHHLFPKFPPNRLREAAPKVKEICERNGVHYHRGSWGKNISLALMRIARMSFPDLQDLKKLMA